MKGQTMKEYAKIEGWTTYVPEFDGNRDDDEPVTVEIRPMTVREAQRRSGRVTARRAKSGGFQTNAVEVTQDIFKACIRNITNLRVGGKPVTTADELLETNLHGLVDELNEAITNVSMLNEGDVKNFKSQSGGD